MKRLLTILLLLCLLTAGTVVFARGVEQNHSFWEYPTQELSPGEAVYPLLAFPNGFSSYPDSGAYDGLQYRFTAPASGYYRAAVTANRWQYYTVELLSQEPKHLSGETTSYYHESRFALDSFLVFLALMGLNAAALFALPALRRDKGKRHRLLFAAGVVACLAVSAGSLFMWQKIKLSDTRFLFLLHNSMVVALFLFCQLMICRRSAPKRRRGWALLGLTVSGGWLLCAAALGLAFYPHDYHLMSQTITFFVGINGTALSLLLLVRHKRQGASIAAAAAGCILCPAMIVSSVACIFLHSEIPVEFPYSCLFLCIALWCGSTLRSSQKLIWRVLNCIGIIAGLLWTVGVFASFCIKALGEEDLPTVIVAAATIAVAVCVLVAFTSPSPGRKHLRVVSSSLLTALLLACLAFHAYWAEWMFWQQGPDREDNYYYDAGDPVPPGMCCIDDEWTAKYDEAGRFLILSGNGNVHFKAFWLDEGETIYLRSYAGDYNIVPKPFSIGIAIEAMEAR